MNRHIAMVAALALLAAPAVGQDPEALSDESWISLSGEVVASTDDAFTLDYGEDLITVEMEDWSWYDTNRRVRSGETVTVLGRVDDDLFEARTIEAESVYVVDRSTYFHASDADAGTDHPLFPPARAWQTAAPSPWRTNVAGVVEKIEGRELTLKAGDQRIQVDTITMPYDPLDELGLQQVDAGDRISVLGEIDHDFFERREILATSIVTLERDATRESSASE